jgi:hypothetical protein
MRIFVLMLLVLAVAIGCVIWLFFFAKPPPKPTNPFSNFSSWEREISVSARRPLALWIAARTSIDKPRRGGHYWYHVAITQNDQTVWKHEFPKHSNVPAGSDVTLEETPVPLLPGHYDVHFEMREDGPQSTPNSYRVRWTNATKAVVYRTMP